MAVIRWTEESVKWLQDIYNYIFKDNPNAAQKVIKGIYDKAQILSTYPKIGYKYREVSAGEIRILLYGHYRIAYLIKQNQDAVEILGVFHGAMKLDKYIK